MGSNGPKSGESPIVGGGYEDEVALEAEPEPEAEPSARTPSPHPNPRAHVSIPPAKM